MPLSIKPRDKGAYFSFLENHELPNGAKKPTEDGIVNACLVCYAFLNEQWNSYERNKVPLVKRLYWLKRVDNRAFTGAEMSLQGEYVAQVMGLQYNSNIPGSLCPFDYGSHIGISCGDIKTVAPSSTNDSNISPEFRELRSGWCWGFGSINLAQKTEIENKKSTETGTCEWDVRRCYEQSKKCNTVGYSLLHLWKLLSKFSCKIHLCYKVSDEEPFFPFIYTLPEPKGAMAISKNGLTQVCCNCKKALCRQWKIFEARSIPISERSYRINDMPVSEHKKISTIPRNKENGFSEFEIEVCYLCGEVSCVGSMHTISTRSENGKTHDSMFCLSLKVWSQLPVCIQLEIRVKSIHAVPATIFYSYSGSSSILTECLQKSKVSFYVPSRNMHHIHFIMVILKQLKWRNKCLQSNLCSFQKIIINPAIQCSLHQSAPWSEGWKWKRYR